MTTKIIHSSLLWRGKEYQLKYKDVDSFNSLPYSRCRQVYGVCFYNDRLVIVKGESGAKRKGWGLVGGHIENGEEYEETLKREVQEETNMKVLKYAPIGYQRVTSSDKKVVYQLRYAALVKPFGKFEKDPGGSVEQIKLINPKNYRKYFDWGEIGERILQRALKIKHALAWAH